MRKSSRKRDCLGWGRRCATRNTAPLGASLEKKEIWRNIDSDPKTNEPRMVPAIYLLYWKVQEEEAGVGKMMGFEYTLYDNTSSLNWDIVKD